MSRKNLGETLAAVGVIGSLVFVGIEIRQNTAAVRGATLQAISDAYTASSTRIRWMRNSGKWNVSYFRAPQETT